jgi:hypothetical protein
LFGGGETISDGFLTRLHLFKHQRPNPPFRSPNKERKG